MLSKNMMHPCFPVLRSTSTLCLMRLCTLAMLFALSINANAGMIFTDDFEKGVISKKTSNSGWGRQACDDKAIMPVRAGQFGAPAPRAGNYMLRTKAWAEGRPSSCNGLGRIRTELIGGGVVPPEKARWIGVSTYIPKAKGMGEEKPITFFQLASTASPSGYQLFNLELIQGEYWLKNFNPSKQNRQGQMGTRERSFVARVEYDVWTDWVFHIKFTSPSSKETGYVQIWKNGELIYNWKGHSIRNNFRGSAYRKIGMYVHKGWPKSNPSEMVMYHDEYRIGDDKSSYKEVSPGGKPATGFKIPSAPTGLGILKQ